ncbi:unnamed protein product [Ilex paraguariensis]|uniref:NADH-plastoquinone oxidoreductase subunit 5 n=1 Tax=Ilex paraguariensis TaxID=185542 RepID=A0ABC8UMF3_9AQUA
MRRMPSVLEHMRINFIGLPIESGKLDIHLLLSIIEKDYGCSSTQFSQSSWVLASLQFLSMALYFLSFVQCIGFTDKESIHLTYQKGYTTFQSLNQAIQSPYLVGLSVSLSY